ncbi:MAG TPA: pitrilysin family protein [Candidatus Eisenbacteria bacterium]|nr:pitrilysin family protein [Candidatus Eisenbacteria bacterium]
MHDGTTPTFSRFLGRLALPALLAALLLAPSARSFAQERVVPDSLPERPRVPAYDPGQPYVEKTLKNGVRLILQEQRSQYFVAGVVTARMGARYERDEEAGLGHLLVRTMLAGTTKSSASDFHVRLRGNSAKLDGAVGVDVGQLTVETDREHAQGAASLLADIVLNPSLPDTAFEAARVKVAGDAAFAYESPLPAAYGVFLNAMFAGTPYHKHPQGLVSAINQARRSDIVALHKKVFVGGNITVVFIGNLDAKKLLAHLEKAFAAAPAGAPPEPAGPEPTPLPADTVIVEERPWKAHAFVYGFPAPGYLDPDYPAFAMLDSYLRSEDRSPITYWMQVRDDAVSPGVLFTMFPTRGSLAVYFGSTPEKIAAARDTAIAVVNRLRTDVLDKGEWKVQLQRVQNGFLFKQNEPIFRARYVSRWVAQGLGVHYPRKFEEILLKLTADDLRAAAERWMTRSCEVRLGPPASAEPPPAPPSETPPGDAGP